MICWSWGELQIQMLDYSLHSKSGIWLNPVNTGIWVTLFLHWPLRAKMGCPQKNSTSLAETFVNIRYLPLYCSVHCTSSTIWLNSDTLDPGYVSSNYVEMVLKWKLIEFWVAQENFNSINFSTTFIHFLFNFLALTNFVYFLLCNNYVSKWLSKWKFLESWLAQESSNSIHFSFIQSFKTF